MSSSDLPEGFYSACRVSDLKENSGKRIFINDTDVAVFRVNGEIFAVSNVCPHQHSAVIYEGIVEDEFVVCPVHGWKFNLCSGRQPAGYKGLDTYEVKIINGDVYIKAAQKEMKW